MSFAINTNRWMRSAVWIILCGTMLPPLAGCTAFQSACSTKWMEEAFNGDDPPIDYVAVRWDNHLRASEDPSGVTAGTSGLIGRAYLFSEQTNQMCEARGAIVVAMFDATPGVSGKTQTPIAQWKFNEEHLKKLQVKDPVSKIAYTLFLPWENYRPEVKQVKLLVKYIARKGEQHLASPSLLTLQPPDQSGATLRESVRPVTELLQNNPQSTAPTKHPQGGLPYAPVQMEKLMPLPGPALSQANSNVPAAAPPVDPPYQAIVMPSQVRTPTAPSYLDELPKGSAKTTVIYGAPPAR